MKYHGEVLSLDGDTLFAIDSGDGLIEICMDDQTNIQLSVSMNNRQAQDLARHLLAASETPQPSPVATRAETEAAPELVAEAQGHSHRPVAFMYSFAGRKLVTMDERWANNYDENYQGLYVRDGR